MVKEWCPQASIVFDENYIISDFNNAIDKVRRKEQKNLYQISNKMTKISKFHSTKGE
ncbi:MAG: transposase [archaeon]